MPSFAEMPVLVPLGLVATSERRRFMLYKPWRIYIPAIDAYPGGLVHIPKGTIFDGASIPFPWLMAALTNGLLRPDGVLFIPALIHDFAHQHGGLIFERDGLVFEPFTRAQADLLFKNMIAEEYPVLAAIAHAGVRLGNLFAKEKTPGGA